MHRTIGLKRSVFTEEAPDERILVRTKIFYCRLLHFSEQPFWDIIAIMEILKIDKRFSKTVSLS